jgi:predicted DNA binding CopG/RHH family protein
MNFISTFEELDKLYESVSVEESVEEPLTEGKIIDGLKKVGTRLKADVSTIVRCFAELSGVDALEDLATYVEDKAVLKALQSGNERVLNTLTVEDIEELKQDIEDYERAKRGEEPLTEGKIIDGLKKVGTRLGADVATIVRCFAEISGVDALDDLATHVENKAVLKALQSGNERVLNTLTKEDIEELEQDIKDYEDAKKAKKSGVKEQLTEDSAAEKITWELSNNLGPVVKQTFGSKEEALAYANKYDIGNATQLVGTRYLNGEYLGHIEYKIKNCGNNGYFEYKIVESCGKNLQEDSDVEIEIVEDEAKQVVLECKKCGALVVIDEADLKNSEDSDLVNIDDECKFCSEKEGYSVIGTLVPYETEEAETEEIA